MWNIGPNKYKQYYMYIYKHVPKVSLEGETRRVGKKEKKISE
jgi:hypothetical protein